MVLVHTGGTGPNQLGTIRYQFFFSFFSGNGYQFISCLSFCQVYLLACLRLIVLYARITEEDKEEKSKALRIKCANEINKYY